MSLLHTVYAPVPELGLEDIYLALDKKYDNKYPSFRCWIPHIDILTWRVYNSTSEEYIRNLKEFNNKLPSFKAEIAHLRLRSSGKYTYVMLEMDSKAFEVIKKIRMTLNDAVKNLVDYSVPGFYKKHWGKYTKIQKERIKRVGSPHKYYPHITLIKLSQSEAKEAIKDLDDENLEGLSWEVSELVITRQKGKGEFPVQGKIKLRKD